MSSPNPYLWVWSYLHVIKLRWRLYGWTLTNRLQGPFINGEIENKDRHAEKKDDLKMQEDEDHLREARNTKLPENSQNYEEE